MSRHEFAVNLVCKQRIQGGETVTFELYLHVKGMIALSYINHPAGIESRSSSLRLDLDRSRICAFYEIYDCATLKVSTNWHTPEGCLPGPDDGTGTSTLCYFVQFEGPQACVITV